MSEEFFEFPLAEEHDEVAVAVSGYKTERKFIRHIERVYDLLIANPSSDSFEIEILDDKLRSRVNAFLDQKGWYIEVIEKRIYFFTNEEKFEKKEKKRKRR